MLHVIWRRRLPALRLVGFFLCFVPGSVAGQWGLDATMIGQIQRGIDHIYNLEFYDADKQFEAVMVKVPKHPAGHFFKAMTQWWRILSNFDDESQDDRFYRMLETVIDICDGRLEHDAEDVTSLFFKGGALGFRGRLRANRGSWFGAARDGMAALPLVQKAHKLDPSNYDVLLGMGIYHYYADVIPNEYPIVKPFMVFFPPGDRKKGFEELKLAAEKSTYARTEATYFMMQNYFTYEKDYLKAMELARGLTAAYPRNPVFLRFLGRCHITLGQWDEAHLVFSDVAQRHAEGQVGFDRYEDREAQYYLGKYLFMKGQDDEALIHFVKCDEASQGLDKDTASGFQSMANLYIGMIYDLQSKRREALSRYRKVLRMKQFQNSHDEARRYITQPYKRPG